MFQFFSRLLTPRIGLQVVRRADSNIGMVSFDPTMRAFSVVDRLRDESFNSITGLNGSGKSNILDSICFVLGITNMSTVRAQNLQVCLRSLCGTSDRRNNKRYRTLYTSEAKRALRKRVSRLSSTTEIKRSRLSDSRSMPPSALLARLSSAAHPNI